MNDYDSLQSKFEKSCDNNNIKMASYLLSTPKLREHIDIRVDDSQLIKQAVESEYKELSKLLLSQPEITYSDKQEVMSHAFANACYQKDIKAIKTLYDEHKDFIALDYNSTWCFRTAYSNSRYEALEFLILEAHIDKENEWVRREMYQIYPLKEDTLKFCESLFLARTLNKTLIHKKDKTQVKI